MHRLSQSPFPVFQFRKRYCSIHRQFKHTGVVDNATSPASFKKALKAHLFKITISNIRYVFSFTLNCSCKVSSNFRF